MPCPYFTYSLPSNVAECMATRVGDTGNGELERQGDWNGRDRMWA